MKYLLSVKKRVKNIDAGIKNETITPKNILCLIHSIMSQYINIAKGIKQ